MSRQAYLRHPVQFLRLLVLRAVENRAPFLVRASLQRAIDEIKLGVYHSEGLRHGRYVLAKASKPYTVNIGCGDKPLQGWLNVDVHPKADLHIDIRRPLPLPDCSCAVIYSEHVIEHFAYPGEVEQVLADWYRALMPRGVLDVGFPDTEGPLGFYCSKAPAYFEHCRHQEWNPPWNRTRLDQINFLFRQQFTGFGQDHLYAYDFETVAERLRSAGFVDIQRREFDPATDSRPGTCYVRAFKPEAASMASDSPWSASKTGQ
jgi:SAM-dependent methyltransferase